MQKINSRLFEVQADAITHNTDNTPPVTGQASHATPTVTFQHFNETYSHTNAMATMTNEALYLLSSQLQQLPQQQRINLYFKRYPVAPKYLSHRSPFT